VGDSVGMVTWNYGVGFGVVGWWREISTAVINCGEVWPMKRSHVTDLGEGESFVSVSFALIWSVISGQGKKGN